MLKSLAFACLLRGAASSVYILLNFHQERSLILSESYTVPERNKSKDFDAATGNEPFK